MKSLSFGSFVFLIKEWTKDSFEETVNTLLGAITKPLDLKNQYGGSFHFDKSQASRLINLKEDVPIEIQRALDSKEAKSSIIGCFRERIIPSGLISNREFMQKVLSLINSDSSIHYVDKESLTKSAKENPLEVFLAEVFLFSIPRTNTYNKGKKANNPSKQYSPKLLLETGGFCPKPGCGRPLYSGENNKNDTFYEVVIIDSSGDIDKDQNQIAICPQCAAEFNATRDASTLEDLKTVKAKIVNQTEAKRRSSAENLDDEIRAVLDKIESFSTDEVTTLSYDPVKIENKIGKSNGLLQQKILSQATTYYSFIKEVSQQLSSEGKMNFDRIAVQVKLRYLNESKHSSSQSDIFYAIVKWFETKTSGSFEACEIVTSFFVQNCEVFEVIDETA